MMVHLFIYELLGASLVAITSSRTRKLNPILAFGILWAVLNPWRTLQSDMTTISGQVAWGSICHLFLFFPLYRWTNQYLKTKKAALLTIQQP
jgi:hypothetical protein